NLPDDISLDNVISPTSNSLTSCQTGVQTELVTIDIKNNSNNPWTNILASYSVNGGTPVSQNISGPLNINQTLTHTFSTPIIFNTSGLYNIKIWISHANDVNNLNDTMSIVKNVSLGSAISTFPDIFDFETQTLCDSANNCSLTICPISGGSWSNMQNGSEDQVDWRVHSGTTPSGAQFGSRGPS